MAQRFFTERRRNSHNNNDDANVRILSDEEISAWAKMTNYEAIQDKWADAISGTTEVLDGVRYELLEVKK